MVSISNLTADQAAIHNTNSQYRCAWEWEFPFPWDSHGNGNSFGLLMGMKIHLMGMGIVYFIGEK